MSEIGIFCSVLFVKFQIYGQNYFFFMNKTQKINKSKNTLILAKLEELVFNLMMNITKMGKTLKSEKFI